ncbi:hypothetical protein [Halorussus caseinilyticus]|uniref:Uncharacterized protein n=1 Tax=Halorussus caseinilyticus TaxID=3034025 RepID=A0ABD5WM89_9EURY|nr:hypothetical protein [Halorussus sp. DT72]
MGIPQNDKRYNVLFAFYVDNHDYESETLSTLDQAAEQWLEEITELSAVTNVDAYLRKHDAKTPEFFADRLDR